MTDTTGTPGAGGFIPSKSLPSPAPSGTSTRSASGLPHPRAHPLRPGSAKEEKIRIYVENQLMCIARRFVKKFEEPRPDDDVVGYKNVGELCKDIEALLDILWLSGTRKTDLQDSQGHLEHPLINENATATLQIPSLLNLANEFTEWVTRFPPQPTPMFSLLRKLDFCFASLLSGHDMDTKETLPGFENGVRGVMTKTHMVRCKSIVEQTRVVVVDVMNKRTGVEETEKYDDDDDDDDTMDTETELETEAETDAEVTDASIDDRPFVDPNWDDEDDDLYMDVARVYERTLIQLGEVLQHSTLP